MFFSVGESGLVTLAGKDEHVPMRSQAHVVWQLGFDGGLLKDSLF